MGLPAAALVLGGVGTAMQVAGQVQAGSAAKSAADFQAQVARNNAITAEQNKEYALESGDAQATAVSLKGANAGGRLKAAQAANNIDVNSGSAKEVQTGQKIASRLDTLTTENNALLQAYGYQTTANSDTAQASIDEATGKQAETGADIGAAGTLLGNASSLGFKFNGLQQSQTGTNAPLPAGSDIVSEGLG